MVIGTLTPLRGPHFGSYRTDEVGWLLTDLSEVALESSAEEREPAIQAGISHYAESLPIEYEPSAAYRYMFHRALAASARRLAYDIGVVSELILHRRGGHVVLLSLARAGTPIGILIRRWAHHIHGLTLPHYAVSIIRGRGIDTAAIRYVAAHHDPKHVMFVDGWTGKGTITRELSASLAMLRIREGIDLPTDLAVLADPAGSVPLHATRSDYLIPSACLNSTVSGLVSRTVLNEGLTGPDDFHGAKFYRDLTGVDVSEHFLDVVTAEFDEVAPAVVRDWPSHELADRTPTWAGWAAVDRISTEYGIHDVNLVKPGVGETTRVLLRRVPWRILVHADALDGLGHIRLLARQRGVPLEIVENLPYSCVGLVRRHVAG